jgi:predicted NAD-dependent protein-ADP-ribosyltransferase YbiA (DUF1768 family)
MNKLSSNSCGSNRSKLNTLINSLGRVENYDATQVNCVSFSKASDIVDGVNIRLTNMAGGYPFTFGGVTWKDSETLYLCGEFSDASDKHLFVQEDMQRQTSGFAAKRFVKKRNKAIIRQDFTDFRVQWMLYVVWQKCKGNTDFANMLLQLPHEIIIIEDTTKQHCDTKEVWGCTNQTLATRRAEVKKEIIKQAKMYNPMISKAALKRLVNIETCKVNGIGVFVGQNNFGKILMICRDCLVYGTEPPIDYNLLESKDIHILGKRISFIH